MSLTESNKMSLSYQNEGHVDNFGLCYMDSVTDVGRGYVSKRHVYLISISRTRGYAKVVTLCTIFLLLSR